jgi:restriction endonuclease S subunit
MADLGSGRRSLLEAGAIVQAGRAQALGRVQIPTEKARLVNRDEVAANEFSFAPSRYLSRLVNLEDEVVKLGDICTIVRPPAMTKDTTFIEVAEIGLSDLQQWKPFSGEVEKTVYLKTHPKEESLLRPGDIVLSVKGTVGRAALVGDAARRGKTVVSQSCVILRLSLQQRVPLPPEVLLMYLRSPHGQAQLEGLQVGAGVQHISPGTLMSAYSVPLPPYETCQEIQAEFAKLCELEDQMSAIKQAMTEITWRRWPGEFL